MKPRTIHTLPGPAIHYRMMARRISRDLNPRLLRDIGVDPAPEPRHIPPFAALITRV